MKEKYNIEIVAWVSQIGEIKLNDNLIIAIQLPANRLILI